MRYIILLFATLSLGCTHVQLRKNTVRQAYTIGDVYQLEVMNNLAMFVYDPNSLPSFSYANQSGSNITDTGNLSVMPGWTRLGATPFAFLFGPVMSTFGASRQALESYTLTPVNDPRKLELMRCAYQEAVAACGRGRVSGTCPDCETRFKVFYTGDENGDIVDKAKGAVTSECLKGTCWFRVGCKKCVPKDCPCNYVGQYCGVYTWVLPGGRDQLAKLTLAILDYALNSAPTPVTKTVSYYLDEQGVPTTSDKAVGSVAASIDVSERNESILNLPRATEVELRDSLLHQLADLEEEIGKFPAEGQALLANREDLKRRNDLLAQHDAVQARILYIENQLKVEGLKHPFVSAPSLPPVMPNAIQYGNYLNTILGGSTVPAISR